MTQSFRAVFTVFVASAIAAACGDDEGAGGNPAVQRGVGAGCSPTQECAVGLDCLAFKGGYCGLEGCAAADAATCPAGSACVAHDDGKSYCFLVCGDKPDCNVHRAVDQEANCESSVTFVEPGLKSKACVPPSG